MRNLQASQASIAQEDSKERLAELIAALSLATGLGMGQPMELPLRTARLAVEIGRRLNLAAPDLSDVYYLALVVHIGCTSDSQEFAGFTGGDDIALRQHSIKWPNSEPPEILSE